MRGTSPYSHDEAADAAITREREERQAVVAELEGSIKRQSAKLDECERELRNVKVQHDNDMRGIPEVCTTVLRSFQVLPDL